MTANNLQELLGEYALSSPALMLLGHFNRDPYAEFARLHKLADPPIFTIDSPELILPLHGFTEFVINGEVVDLRRRLYAVHRNIWEPCRDCISSMTWFSRQHKFYGSSAYQDVVFDGLPVTVFLADSTAGFAHFEQYGNSPPKLAWCGTSAAVRREADALLGE